MRAALRSVVLLLLLLAAPLGHADISAMFLSRYTGPFGGSPLGFFAQNAAVNYNTGGQGYGYNVPSPACSGNVCAAGAASYRPDAVNFKPSTFGSGFNWQLAFSQAPNSFNYTVNFSQPGPYIITLWLADSSAGGSWNVYIDGQLVGNVVTPNTGNHSTFQTSSSAAFAATMGIHTLKLGWGSGDTQFQGSGDIVAWQGGVSGSGPPPGAVAAGYTTLAFSADFTTPFYATLSNWLNCAGASSPKMWNISLSGSNTNSCSRISMVNDGGTQVVDLNVQPADITSNGSLGTALSIMDADHFSAMAGMDLPLGAYLEATFRVSASGFSGNPFGTEVAAWWSWSDTGQETSTAFLEFDNPEFYGNTCCHNNVNTHGYWGAGASTLAGFGQPEYPIDITTYHTLALRITSDGTANFAYCFYIDNVFQNCLTQSGDPSVMYDQRRYPVIDAGVVPGQTLTVPLDTYIKSIRIWTCANGLGPILVTGHDCNGPVLNGPP